MTGLIIAGYNLLAAAFLQVIIYFRLIGGGLIASLIGLKILQRNVVDENMALNLKNK